MTNLRKALRAWWGCRHQAALARLEGQEWKSLLVPFPWSLALAWGYISLLVLIVTGGVIFVLYMTWPLSGILTGLVAGFVALTASVVAAINRIDKEE